MGLGFRAEDPDGMLKGTKVCWPSLTQAPTSPGLCARSGRGPSPLPSRPRLPRSQPRPQSTLSGSAGGWGFLREVGLPTALSRAGAAPGDSSRSGPGEAEGLSCPGFHTGSQACSLGRDAEGPTSCPPRGPRAERWAGDELQRFPLQCR